MSHHRAVLLHLPKNEPINIEFENITLRVKNDKGKGKKEIIKGVSGQFRSGELTAIMGPSGAGKSSLLNILTGFQTSGVTGAIKSNGIERSKKSKEGNFKKETCYILQDDRLCPLFTVLEVMTMATDLKLGYSLSDKAKKLLIEDILDTLGLERQSETRCGDLSGGQKKRLSIALELIDNPPVMFLDEPTTGLDSLSTHQCMSMLKALAKSGRTIICTIHTPSVKVYNLCDHVYVLSEGVCVYQGSSGNTVPYLNSVGFPVPQYHSPSDFLLEVAAGDYGKFTQKLAIAAQDTYWRGKHMTEENDLEKDRNKESTKIMVLVRPPSELFRFLILINRNLIQLYRDWTVTHLKVFLHLVVGVTLGVFFTGCGDDGNKTISNIGYIFSTIIYMSYTSLMPAILRFPDEMAVMKKEKFNNWYKLSSYYAAFHITNIPIQMMYSTVYVFSSYYLSGQPFEWPRLSMFWAICFMTSLTAESVGLFLGTLDNIIYGLFWGSIIIALLLVYGGCLAIFPQMSPYLYYLSYISFSRYSFSGLILSVYGFGRKNLNCSITYCHLRIPEKILREIGVEEGKYWINLGALLVMTVVIRTVCFVSLKRKVTST